MCQLSSSKALRRTVNSHLLKKPERNEKEE